MCEITDFVVNQFPGQFCIPVGRYARLLGISYGGCRNRIAAGTFELPLVKQGVRNYVAVLDVVAQIKALRAGVTTPPATPANQAELEEKAPRASKYGEAARARAAAARAARQTKRAATLAEGGVA